MSLPYPLCLHQLKAPNLCGQLLGLMRHHALNDAKRARYTTHHSIRVALCSEGWLAGTQVEHEQVVAEYCTRAGMHQHGNTPCSIQLDPNNVGPQPKMGICSQRTQLCLEPPERAIFAIIHRNRGILHTQRQERHSIAMYGHECLWAVHTYGPIGNEGRHAVHMRASIVAVRKLGRARAFKRSVYEDVACCVATGSTAIWQPCRPKPELQDPIHSSQVEICAENLSDAGELSDSESDSAL